MKKKENKDSDKYEVKEKKQGDMEDVFKGIAEDENENIQVIRELFEEKNIKMKTELLNNEIRGLAKMDFLIKKFNIPVLDVWVQSFLRYRVSLARKGRAEFIDALKSHRDEEKLKGGISELLKSGKL